MLGPFLFALGLIASVLSQRVVDTQYGQVRSHVVNVDNGREQTTVDVYYGIPFGADTSGANRFMSPVQPEPWTGILEADTIPDACPQNGLSGFSTSEDCLKLNIYAPTNRTATYPVLVWIYGGAYQSGANFYFPGHFLASRGVVLVILNYRLNKFGFSFTGNDACPGNAGLWDQAMGIQFVVDNIANFGGDPSKITVFGESAGASSASLQMLSPQTNQLFQQAIVQSGSEQVFWGLNPPDSDPAHFTYNMAEDLNCTRDDDYEMMDCMRELSWREVSNAQIGRCTRGYICLGMAPVVDGPGGFMPQHPAQQRLDGDVMQGSIMAGICEEDGSLFAPVVAPGIVFDDCCNRTYFEHCLRNNMVDFFDTRIDNVTSEDLFQAMNWYYSPWPHIYDNDENRFALVRLVTDVSFGAAWDKQVRDQQALAPTFSYLYDYMSNRSNSDEWVGTPHGADIDMVFGFPQLFYNPDVRNDSGLSGGIPTAQDVEFTIFVQELWTNFAKYGNPTPTPLVNPIDGGPFSWPQYTENDMNYLYMGETDVENRKEYRQKNYAYWTYYSMGMAGEQLGIEDYWDVYGEGVDPEILLDSWMSHFTPLYNEHDEE